MNSSGKVILNSKKNVATYTLSDISLEYDAIFDKRYATKIVELYAGAALIPSIKATSMYLDIV